MASLLAESEGVAVEEDGKDGEEQSDDLEALFDDEAKSEEEYKDEIDEIDEMLDLSEHLDKEGEKDDQVQKDIGAATTSQDLQGLCRCSASICNAWQIEITSFLLVEFTTWSLKCSAPQRSSGACRKRCVTWSSSWKRARMHRLRPRTGLQRNRLRSNQRLPK